MKFINVKVIGYNITMDVYRRRDPAIPRGHKDYVMSRGELVDFARCPKKWIEGGEEEDDTKATDWGSLLDTLLLTPERFTKEYAVQPLTYKTTKMQCPNCDSVSDSKKCSKCKCDRNEVEVEKEWSNNSTTCSEWTEEQRKAGLRIVKQEVLEQARIAANKFRKDERLLELIQCSKKQVMIVATYVDEITSIEVPLKILLDFEPDKDHELYGKSLGDLKTARSAEKHAWDTAVGDHGYDVQLALYMAIHKAAYPDQDRQEWRYAIQENTAPYITGRRLASLEQMEVGGRKLRAALRDYCICLATGVWPAYDDYGDTYNGWGLSEPKEWQINAMFGMGLKLPEKVEAVKEVDPDNIP